MLDAYYSPGLWAYVAGGCYVLGLLVINQVFLRLLLLLGSGFYVLYYATVAETPLLAAIYVSLMIATANMLGLASLLIRRSRLAVPSAFADVFVDFPPLPPGDFRVLVKLCRRRTLSKEEKVIDQGAPGRKLYYVVEGTAYLRKDDADFSLPPHVFLGEIAFLTGRPSTATAWLPAGAEVLEWDFDVLSRRCRRSSRFQLALEAAISIDLASKVARAIGPNSIRYPIGAPAEEAPVRG